MASSWRPLRERIKQNQINNDMTHHSIPIRIYYEDTDAGGIVYHANYIRFGERGRTEFLRNCGYSNTEINQKHGVIFVVKHIEIEYHAPSRLDDLLRMDTALEEMRNTSFIMTHKIYRSDEHGNDMLIAELRVVLVCVDINTIKPTKMPEELKSKFQTYIE